MLKVISFLIFLYAPLAFGQSFQPPPAFTAPPNNFEKIQSPEQEAFELGQKMIMDKLSKGEMTSEKALELYKIAETLLAEKIKKETDVKNKDVPNPVYCGGKCIENCENRTGFVDAKIGGGCL